MVAKVHSTNSYREQDFGNYIDLTSVTECPETAGGEGFAHAAYDGLSCFEKLLLEKKRFTPVAIQKLEGQFLNAP